MPKTVGNSWASPDSPCAPLLIGLAAGLFTGLGEALILGINKFLLGDIHIIHSPHFIWMSPLTNMFLCGMIGMGFLLINHIRPHTISPHTSLVLFSLFVAVSLLLMFPSFPSVLIVSLSLGLSIFFSKVCFTAIPTILSVIRQSLKILVPSLLGLAVLFIGKDFFVEKYQITHLPPPVSNHVPNVLLIVLDTVRAKNLSLYGYERDTTPRLKEFAKTGAKFDRAVSTAPWTLPSHASMFTGQYAHRLSTNWRKPLDQTFPTLAEELQKRGYLTAGFVGNLEYCSYVYGLNRGFVHYEDFEFSLGEFAVSSSIIRRIFGIPNFRWFDYYELLNRKRAPHINESFLHWLNQTQSEGRPFFAFLNYFDAHEPYLPPSPYNQLFAKHEKALPFADLWKKYTPNETQPLKDLYDGSIAYLDSQIGDLLDTLRDKGLLHNTLVVITSDHGEEFSEHGIPSHGHSLYIPSLHVPLLISYPPKVPANLTVPEWVSLRDLPATILDLLNLDGSPRNFSFPGQSLARYWRTNEVPVSTEKTPLHAELRYAIYLPEWFPVSKGDMKSIISENLHYIIRGDGQEEIYDLQQDPWEENNLAQAIQGVKLAGCLREDMLASLDNNSKGTTLVQYVFTKPEKVSTSLQKTGTRFSCRSLLNHPT